MPPKRSPKSQAQASELPDGAEDIENSSELITAISAPIPLKNRPRLHLFATILTYAAPSSNHHGKGDDNENPLQIITKQGRDYPVISPYAIREALRRMLSAEKLPYNRSRIHDGGAPKVEFKAFPNADLYIDDFFFGFCVTE